MQPVTPCSLNQDWNLILRTIVPLVDQQDLPVKGEDERADISLSFAQPLLSCVTKNKTTLGANTESTYDWENEAWAVPVNATVSQLLKDGPPMLQLSLGARYWVESPENGAEDWGGRAAVTFLFPR